ncbi:MAG: hypothetical protein IIZ67_05560 [Bacilli bacterium]|nr:hypothetical protein [Bacilli bacterium]
MSEEILKVLEKLKDKSNYQRDCNDGSYFIELFANEIYILCKFMEDLQQKVEQLEKELNQEKEEFAGLHKVLNNKEEEFEKENYNNVVEISRLKRKVEQLEKEIERLNNIIDTMLEFSFFKEECPLNFGFADEKEEKAQDVIYEDDYCEENCNDIYKKCWLKYFEKLQKLKEE